MHPHNRTVQPPAQPRLVASLQLVPRLQLLLELGHLHLHQILAHRLHRRRLKLLWRQVSRAQMRPAGLTVRGPQRVAPSVHPTRCRAARPPPRQLPSAPPARLPPAAPALAAEAGAAGVSGGRGGRGRRSADTLAKELASLAAFLARKYGQGSKLAREACAATSEDSSEAEVECLGGNTWEERDAEAHEAAVELERAE